MKTVLYISIMCCLLFSFSGCDQSNQIQAHGNKPITRSVMRLKQRMGFKEGTEFEVAFWSLKQHSTDPTAFRASMIGKTPEEVIELGKQYFAERKQANDPKYTQYASWDTMIAKVIEKIKTPAVKNNQRQATPGQNKANRIQGF